MSKSDADAYEGRVRDDSLRLSNLTFFIAIGLAAVIVIFAYASAGQWTSPSTPQTSPSVEGLKVQGETTYGTVVDKINEFIEWGSNLISRIT